MSKHFMEDSLEMECQLHKNFHHHHHPPALESEQRERHASLTESESNNSTCTNSSPPPTMLEVLGEHLYTKVEEVQETCDVALDVAKVTGVLLELGEQQVLKLLQDEKLLQQFVKRVIQHVPRVVSEQSVERHELKESRKEDSDLDSSDEECLYGRVCQLEPELGPHITGMLLELESWQVKSLLESPTRLSQAVTKAKAAHRHHNQSPQHHLASDKTPSVASQINQKFKNTAVETLGGAECTDGNAQREGAVRKRGDNLRDCESAESGECGGGEACLDEEEMGELVHLEAIRLYPEFADKITGMVLDVGVDGVKNLLRDTKQLHRSLHQAAASLSHTNQ